VNEAKEIALPEVLKAGGGTLPLRRDVVVMGHRHGSHHGVQLGFTLVVASGLAQARHEREIGKAREEGNGGAVTMNWAVMKKRTKTHRIFDLRGGNSRCERGRRRDSSSAAQGSAIWKGK
jgi:hypothetical protein